MGRRAMEMLGRPGFSSYVGIRPTGNAVSSTSPSKQSPARRNSTRENGNRDTTMNVVSISEDILRHGRAGNWEMAMKLLQSMVPEAEFENITRIHCENASADPEQYGRWETAFQMLDSLVHGKGSDLPQIRST